MTVSLGALWVDRDVSSMCLVLPLPFILNALVFREGNSLADQIKCKCVSCPFRVRVLPFILRSLWSIQFSVHLLGLSDRGETSSSSFVIRLCQVIVIVFHTHH